MKSITRRIADVVGATVNTAVKAVGQCRLTIPDYVDLCAEYVTTHQS